MLGEIIYNEVKSHYQQLDQIVDKDKFISTVENVNEDFTPRLRKPMEENFQALAENIYNELDRNFNFPDIIDILSKNVLIPIIINIIKGIMKG